MTLYEQTDILGLALVTLVNWRRPHRLIVSAFFMLGEFSFVLFFGDTSDAIAYYFFASLFSMLPILLMSSIRTSRMVHDMQVLCGVGVMLNIGGYFLWLTYCPPIFYNVAMESLLVIELARLIARTPDDKRTLAMDAWRCEPRRVRPVDQATHQQNEVPT